MNATDAETTDSWCEVCGERLSGSSHYHCPNCGERCSMMGHLNPKGTGYSCQYKPNPLNAKGEVMPDPTSDTPGSLHSQILNLPINPALIAISTKTQGEWRSYKCGHRDARHAAASLVAGHETPVDVEAVAKRIIGGFLHHRIGDEVWTTSDERLRIQYPNTFGEADRLRDAIVAELRPLLSGAPAGGGGEQGGEGRG